MVNKYLNSIAQEDMNFITETVYQTTPGDNYFKFMAFVGVKDASDYFEDDTNFLSGYSIELTGVNYASIVKTDSTLAKYLANFFAKNTIYSVWIVMYTDEVDAAWDETDLDIQFPLHAIKAYWKTTISDNYQEESILELDLLIEASAKNKKLSALLYGSGESALVTSPDTTSIVCLLNEQLSNAYASYHSDADTNSMLAQLGEALSYLNSTGTPVGNKLSMSAFNTIAPSGTSGGKFNTDN